MAKVPKVVLLLESSRQYGRDLVRGIARYSRLYGPWTFYREDVFYSQSKGKNFSWVKKWGANGIITRDSQDIHKLLELGLPTISAGAFQEHIDGVIEIITDNKQICQLAAEHFLRRGFRNFAFCGFEDMPWSTRREESFCSILGKLGFDPNVLNSLSTRMLKWDQEQSRMIKWIKSLPKPVSILCCNDDRGSDVIEACKMAGLAVPFDVAVLGVDNDQLVCELSNPPLSSISLGTEKAGFEAASILDSLISGKKVTVSEINAQPLEVITRLSTDTLAIQDEQVIKALDFINQNSKIIIQTVDVLRAADCSRRGLDEKFRRLLGHTVFAEIRRVRAESIAHLLLETDLTVSQIALDLGYNDSDHIARFFKQEKHMTPQTYRKEFRVKRISKVSDI